MKKNDFVLPILIILLLVFIPCTILGIIGHINYEKEGGNPSHLHKKDGVLYYYNELDKLIGIYECNESDCDDAKTTTSDEVLNYYKDGSLTNLGVLFNNYVFIQDGSVIKLYNLDTSFSIADLKLIKNYGTNLEDNTIILQNSEGKYGLFSIANVAYVVDPIYDFMGLNATFLETDILSTQKIVVKKDDNWYLINKNGDILSSLNTNQIYDYDDDIIYYKTDDGKYFASSYNGNLLTSDNISSLDKTDDHVIYIINDTLYVYNSNLSVLLDEFTSSDMNGFIIIDNKVSILNDEENEIHYIDLNELKSDDEKDDEEVEAQKQLLVNNSEKLIDAAKSAFQAQKLLTNTDITTTSEVCFSIDWLKDNHFYEGVNTESGSVYIKYNTEDMSNSYYVWLSDGTYYLGIDNVGDFIGGIDYTELENANPSLGTVASNTCGEIKDTNKGVIMR